MRRAVHRHRSGGLALRSARRTDFDSSRLRPWRQRRLSAHRWRRPIPPCRPASCRLQRNRRVSWNSPPVFGNGARGRRGHDHVPEERRERSAKLRGRPPPKGFLRTNFPRLANEFALTGVRALPVHEIVWWNRQRSAGRSGWPGGDSIGQAPWCMIGPDARGRQAAMSQLQFDESAAKAVEAMYLTPDVVAQRARVLDLLAPQAGRAHPRHRRGPRPSGPGSGPAGGR